MRHIIIGCMLMFLVQTAFSQNWLYTEHISPVTKAGIRGLILDSDTNLYMSAYDMSSSGTTNFIGPFGSKTYSIVGNNVDIILAKFDQLGDTIWTKSFGGNDNDFPVEVSLDKSNNPYIAGIFKSDSIVIQSTTLKNYSPGTKDIFLAKYTSDGFNGFAKRIAYGSNDQTVKQIALDGLGNIYMVGSYTDSIIFATDTLISLTPTYSSYSLFLAKFKSNGDLRWAKSIPLKGPGSSVTNILEISIANNNEIYLGGFYKDTIIVDGQSFHSLGDAEDMMLIKVDSSGATQWIRTGGSDGLADRCNGITSNPSGYVYETGYFQGTANFDSTGFGLRNSSALTSKGGFDIFLAKYSPSGRLLWKRQNGSVGADIAYGAKIRENVLVFTGYFSDTLLFNNTTITSGSSTNPDAGFFVYDTLGNPITAQSVQGSLEDRAEYLEYDLKGNTYIGGYFKSDTLTIGSNKLGKQASRPANQSDGFVAKYHNPFSATFSTHTEVTCPGGNDGALGITTYFGTSPYTYDWSASTGSGTFNNESGTNLTAGYYQVTIKDARDSVTTISYTIVDPADFITILDSTNLRCYNSNDGSINLTATGGTGTLSYVWSGPGITVPTDEDQSGLSAGWYYVTVTDSLGCSTTDSVQVTEPDPIYFGNVTVMPEDPKDSRTGSIALNVTGGTQPYTYSWDFESILMTGRTYDTLNNLQTGNYTAHVVDDSLCTADTNIFVPGDSLRVSMQGNNVTCYNAQDGQAWTVITSGDLGYSYTYDYTDDLGNPITSVNDTIYDLVPGIYHVLVTEQGGDYRTASSSITISQPDTIILTLSPDTLLCYGDSNGTIGLTVSGGNGSFSYAWSNGDNTQDISNLIVGNYTVTATDSKGCQAVDSATIVQPDSLYVNIIRVHKVLCNGGNDGQLQANVTGGTPGYTYLWDDPSAQTTQIAGGLTANTYSVQATDLNGCVANNNYLLTEPLAINVSIVDSTNVTCKGGSEGSIRVSVTGGTLPYTYLWSNALPDTNFVDNLQALPTAYTLTVSDSSGCTNNTFSHYVEEPVDSLRISIVDTIHNPCYGDALGSIEISGTGGWGAYTYAIDNGSYGASGLFTGLAVNSYITHVRDSLGCITDRTINIKQPDSLDVSISVDLALSCYNKNDATLGANATGGTQPYNYLWDDALAQTTQKAVNLGAGDYSVSITDTNGCTKQAVATLAAPDSVKIQSVDTANIVCFGGTDGHIGLAMQGGTPPYSFDWTPSQTDTNYIDKLVAGDYQVMTYDNSDCPGDTFTFSVKQPAAKLSIEEDTASHIDNLCFGDANGELKVKATGGWGNYEFTANLIDWQTDPVFSNLIALGYTITVQDAEGCTDSVKTNISEPAQIIVNSAVSGSTISTSASGGTPPYQYSLDGVNWQSLGAFNGLTAGTYHVEITDQNNCGPVQSDILTVLTSVSQPYAGLTQIYPNPSSGKFNFEFAVNTEQSLKVEIYALDGRRVFDNVYEVSPDISNSIMIDLTDLANGIYMIKVNGTLSQYKLIKK